MADRKQLWEYGPLGALGHVVGTGERLGTELLLDPIARMFDPSYRERLPDTDIYAADVLRALLYQRGEEPEGLPEKIGLMLGGAALGGLVDPLTYTVGLGGLTKAGHLARAGGALKRLPLAQQAKRGERALLQIGEMWKPPLDRGSITLIKGTGRVSSLPFKAIDLVREGAVAERLTSKIPSTAVHRAATATDRFFSAMGQKFNFQVGVHPALWTTWKNLLSHISGSNKKRLAEVLAEMEPQIDHAARIIADTHGMRYDEARDGILAATQYAHEMLPGRRLLDDGRFEFIDGVDISADEQAKRAFDEIFGTTPMIGGPASPMDTEQIREVRRLMINEGIKLQETAKAQAARTSFDVGVELRLMAGKDQEYVFHMQSPQARDLIQRRVADEVKKVVPSSPATRLQAEPITEAALETIESRAKAQGAFPSAEILNSRFRDFRVINPNTVSRMVNEGILRPGMKYTLEETVEGFGKVYQKVDVMKELTEPSQAGRLISKRQKHVVKALWQSGAFGDPGSEAAYRAVGDLVSPLSAREINEYVYRFGYGDLIRPGEVKQFMLEDPIQLAATRWHTADRAYLNNEFFQSLKGFADDPDYNAIIKKVTDDLPPGYRPILEVPELAGYAMRDKEARFINRMMDWDFKLGKEMSGFLGAYQKALSTWSAWTLAPFPSYYLRNFISAMLNYNLMSDSPIEALQGIALSQKAWRSIRSGKDEAIEGTGVTAHELYRAMADNNVWSSGRMLHTDARSYRQQIREQRLWEHEDPIKFSLQAYKDGYQGYGKQRRLMGIVPIPPREAVEVELSWLQDPKRKLKSIEVPGRKITMPNLSRNSWWIQAGFRLAGAMDNNVRMAAAITELRRYGGKRRIDQLKPALIEDIANAVKHNQFDYEDITSAERTLKLFFPFYVWPRKNIPLQLEALVTQPRHVARFNGSLQAWDGESPGEEALMSDWMRNRFPVRLRRNSKGQNEYFMLRNWHPLVDLYELFRPVEFATMSLTPFARLPLEQLFNVNFYTRSEIERLNKTFLSGATLGLAGGERTELLGARVPRRLSQAARGLLRGVNMFQGILDNPDDLSMLEQMVTIGVGRTYPLDVARGWDSFQYRLRQIKSSQNKAIRSALRKGLVDEVPRIIDLSRQSVRRELQERGIPAR